MRFLRFLTYNNAVPIAVSLMLVGGASAFAATNPETIYSEKQSVLSVDNTYLVGKNLEAYSPRVDIVGVAEDEEDYYVSYRLSTIDLRDYVWQDIQREETMRVSKSELGPYRDLGLYITVQLKQVVDGEQDRLMKTQESERRSVSHKVVATAYSGLVGKFLDSTTEELPGYVPVVSPPAGNDSQAAAVGGSAGPTSNSSGNSSGSSGGMQVLGNNPAQIPIGAAYVDLGAVVTNSLGGTEIVTYVNGEKVYVVTVDTSKESEWKVRYEYSGQAGSFSAERRVIVYDPAKGPPVSASQVQQQASIPVTPSEPPPSLPLPPQESVVPSPTLPIETPPAEPTEQPTPTETSAESTETEDAESFPPSDALDPVVPSSDDAADPPVSSEESVSDTTPPDSIGMTTSS